MDEKMVVETYTYTVQTHTHMSDMLNKDTIRKAQLIHNHKQRHFL